MKEIDLYLEYLEQQDRSVLTIKGYGNDLAHYVTWSERTNGEPCTVTSITPTDVRAYRQGMLNIERRKASTVNRHLASLSSFMAWAVKQGLIERDPTQDIRSVRQVSAGPKYLDKKQQYAINRAIEKDLQLSRLRYPKRWRARQRDASIVLFLMHTGLRLQEALSLRLGDIQIGDRKGQVLVRQGKGGKQRSVPLNAEARRALQEWLNARPDVGNDYFWVPLESDEEGPLSSRSVQRVILRLGQDAGIEHLTPHMLRHTFGKNLVDSGVGLEKVAALLGHANLNTTRIYITPNQNDLEQAVEGLTDHSFSRR